VQLEDFQKFCADWKELAVRKFIDRYRATIGECPVWPRDEAAAFDLL